MLIFRNLKADEIECRVAIAKATGCSLLLYKDARVDQNILDETVGSLHWTRSHQLIGNNLYCTVSIYDEATGNWIAKQDVGTESYTEKEKGQASDSFKRACFNWGIGRELYTAPFIWISAQDSKPEKRANGSYAINERFHVESILYDGKGKIEELKIANEKGIIVYQMDLLKKKERIDETKLLVLKKELERTGVTSEKLCERYKVKNLEEMDIGVWTRAVSALKKSKDKE